MKKDASDLKYKMSKTAETLVGKPLKVGRMAGSMAKMGAKAGEKAKKMFSK